MATVAPTMIEAGSPLAAGDESPKKRPPSARCEDDDEPEGPMTPAQWIHYQIPVWNVLYEMFFDEVPPIEQVSNYLETMLLVTALMLGLCYTLPTGVEHSELEDADLRIALNYADISRDGANSGIGDTPPSYRIFVMTVWSINLLGCGLISGVIIYILLSAANLSKASIAAMWPVLRFMLFLLFLVVAVGAALALENVLHLMAVKFPDYSLKEYENEDWVPDEWRDHQGYFGPLAKTMYFYHIKSMQITTVIATIGTFLVMSVCVYLGARDRKRRFGLAISNE